MSLARRDVTHPSVNVAIGLMGPDTVSIEGVMREPDVVSWFVPLIDELHGEAIQQKLPEIVLDLRRLQYANAAVWKCFAYWIRRVREDPVCRYRLHVISAREYRWQEIGMRMLRVFGADRLVVEATGSAEDSGKFPLTERKEIE